MRYYLGQEIVVGYGREGMVFRNLPVVSAEVVELGTGYIIVSPTGSSVEILIDLNLKRSETYEDGSYYYLK